MAGNNRDADDSVWLNTLLRASSLGTVKRLFGGSPERLDEALGILDDTTDWNLIPDLVPIAFGRDAALSGRAAVAIRRLLHLVPLPRLVRLDKVVREKQPPWSYDDRFTPGWINLNPDALARGATEMGPGLIALCTFHPNGWVRSTAMSALQQHFPGDALPFLLIRLADWVPAIRARALVLSMETVRPGNEAAWCTGLPLLELVERSERAANPDLKAKATVLLDSHAGRAALTSALDSTDRVVRASAFRRLLQNGGEEATRILSSALLDTDPFINRIGVEAIASRDLTVLALPALRAGLHGPQAIVRRHCLDAYARLIGRGALEEVISALKDRAPIVRGVARFYARQLDPSIDFPTIYRKLLGSRSPSLIAVGLQGLAELGVKDATGEIKPYLWARQPHLRATALRAAFDLGMSDLADWLWEALADGEPSNTRLARTLLTSLGPSAIPVARAVRLATNMRKPELARRSAISLLRGLDKWRQPPPLLDIAHRAGGAISEFAVELLEQWDDDFNRLQRAPTVEEVSAFSEALERAEPALPVRLSQALRFAVKPWAAR